jgi:hypothetical protein
MERLAATIGELSIRCIAYFQSNTHYAAGNTSNWLYHYDVIDPCDAADGNYIYHAVELNTIWGPNNTDGAPPPTYYIPMKTVAMLGSYL